MKEGLLRRCEGREGASQTDFQGESFLRGETRKCKGPRRDHGWLYLLGAENLGDRTVQDEVTEKTDGTNHAKPVYQQIDFTDKLAL